MRKMKFILPNLLDLLLTIPTEENKKKDKDNSYSARDIEVLEGLEPVRRRPGMYIGGTDEVAMHHLVAETLDNYLLVLGATYD